MRSNASGKARDTLVVIGLAVVWLGAAGWARPLMLPDEGRYVGVAWEMLRSGEWTTPTLNGLPYFHKPPLFYWLTALSLSALGLNEWAARIAPLIGGTAGVAALYLFSRRWLDERSARIAVAALLFQPLYFVAAQFANMDMLVAGGLTATILWLAHCALALEAGLSVRWHIRGAYAVAAMTMLSKGLIAFVIPALVIGSWLVTRGKWKVMMGLWSWSGALVLLAIAAPWFVAMQLRYPEFLNYFFLVQHFQRFTGSGFNNVRPFWFYPAIMLVVMLPWLPWLMGFGVKQVFEKSQRARIVGLLWIWAFVVVIFFSIPRSKLIGYILPALPPLALIATVGVTTRLGAAQVRTRLWHASLVLGAFLGLSAVSYVILHPRDSSRELGRTLAAFHRADEPVFMISGYRFDLPFYARLTVPVAVVDDWSSGEVARRDNWRKELADAAHFGQAQQASVLIEPKDFPAALCRSPVNWVVGSEGSLKQMPMQADATAVFNVRGLTLWRVVVSNEGQCSQGTPNGGSMHK